MNKQRLLNLYKQLDKYKDTPPEKFSKWIMWNFKMMRIMKEIRKLEV